MSVQGSLFQKPRSEYIVYLYYFVLNISIMD